MVIKLDKMLVYHDLPLLFTGKCSEMKFICMAIPDTWGMVCPYLCVELTKKELKDFLANKRDLLDCFASPTSIIWYAGELTDILEVKVVATNIINIPNNCLPTRGFSI